MWQNLHLARLNGSHTLIDPDILLGTEPSTECKCNKLLCWFSCKHFICCKLRSMRNRKTAIIFCRSCLEKSSACFAACNTSGLSLVIADDAAMSAQEFPKICHMSSVLEASCKVRWALTLMILCLFSSQQLHNLFTKSKLDILWCSGIHDDFWIAMMTLQTYCASV